MTKRKRDLITLLDLSSEEIEKILELAKKIKEERNNFNNSSFKNKSAVMIFEKPSLRTRITFETAIYELGGNAISLSSDMIGMGKRESVKDIAKNLERWVHLIIARTYSHNTVEELAHYSSIPVINALTDLFHPCQALAFAQTLREHRKELTQIKVVFVGDGNNVCNSLMVLCAKMGYNFTAICPPRYVPDHQILSKCVDIAKQKGSSITVTNQIDNSLSDATVIYTDVWTSMGQEKEAERRKRDFAAYQVNSDLLSKAPSDVLVSHCLPAHREEEITSEVLDSEHSIAFDEAENRLHVQKAIIVYLFSE
ncbi:MAG: ornithine carbamoyltransferase [Chitinispirillaceae bacterium]|nr:ornithine carbamoyltransferase [Chitinispirillaceae bacterium]